MKSLKNIICVVLLVFGGFAVRDGRETMPKSAPTFNNVAYQENVSAFQRTYFGSALMMSAWDVEDYYLFKIARLRGSKETWLATTILSNGKWHK